MQYIDTMLFYLLVALGAAPIESVPEFDINLDGPPESRWAAVATYFKPEIISLLEKIGLPVVNSKVDPRPEHFWINEVAFDKEYEKELEGIANVLNEPTVTLERLKWLNMLYEMHGPNYAPGCTSVLMTTANGTVMHGRNADDDSPFRYTDEWAKVTLVATMHRSGRPLLKMTTAAGQVGVHTGMRLGHKGNGKGWSLAQHARKKNGGPNVALAPYWAENAWSPNLVGAALNGQVSMLTIRRVMETTDDYDKAVQMLYSIPFMAPHYFIVSGSGPNQGAVITLDRLALVDPYTPPVKKIPENINSTKTDDWFLIQVNEDPSETIPEHMWDPRRKIARDILALSPREAAANKENLMQLMHTRSLFNDGTVHSTVMVPATGHYQTILPNDPPAVVDGAGFQQQYENWARSAREGLQKEFRPIQAPGVVSN